MKTGPTILFVLSALFLLSAFRNIGNAPEGAVRVSYLVGSFMPSLVCLIAGLIFHKRSEGEP